MDRGRGRVRGRGRIEKRKNGEIDNEVVRSKEKKEEDSRGRVSSLCPYVSQRAKSCLPEWGGRPRGVAVRFSEQCGGSQGASDPSCRFLQRIPKPLVRTRISYLLPWPRLVSRSSLYPDHLILFSSACPFARPAPPLPFFLLTFLHSYPNSQSNSATR